MLRIFRFEAVVVLISASLPWLLFAQQSYAASRWCGDFEARYSRVGGSYNTTFAGAMEHLRQPRLAGDGFTGAGTAVVQLEKKSASWFFRFDDDEPAPPLGACIKPADAPPDHWGWAPESDPAYPEFPCKIAWAMCISAHTELGEAVEKDGDGAAAGLSECTAYADGWDEQTSTITSTYTGGHATTTAIGIVSTAPDTKIISISIPEGTDLAYKAAYRWLYTAGDAYSAGSAGDGSLYLLSDQATEWQSYWAEQFGSQTPIESFNVVATNQSWSLQGPKMVFSEACEGINPDIPQTNQDNDSRIDIADNCIFVDNEIVTNLTGDPENPIWISEFPDGDRDNYGNLCDGDFDNDGDTDNDDLSLFASIRDDFESFVPPLDLNGDEIIDDIDKQFFFAAADINFDGVIDELDSAHLNTLVGKPPGPSMLDINPFLEHLRRPEKYIQDRIQQAVGLIKQNRADHSDYRVQLAALRANNVLPVFSALNQGYTNALPMPACFEDAVAATGISHLVDKPTYKQYDKETNTYPLNHGLTNNASPNHNLLVVHGPGVSWWPLFDPEKYDIAEGCEIDPTSRGGGAASFAAPVVAGSIAVLRSQGLAENETVDEIESRLHQTDQLAYVRRDCTVLASGQAEYTEEDFYLHCPNTLDPAPETSKNPQYALPVVDLAAAAGLDPNDGIDSDNDGLNDFADNCTNVANAKQKDSDGDAYGDACDADYDNNGTVDNYDVNQFTTTYLNTASSHGDFNADGSVNDGDYTYLMENLYGFPPGPSGQDIDSDGIPNHLDNCRDIGNGPWTERPLATLNINQRDTDGDYFGNACDGDLDNNGRIDNVDVLFLDSAISSGNYNRHSDFNGDNIIDETDRDIFNAQMLAAPALPPGPSGMCLYSEIPKNSPNMDCESGASSGCH